MKYTLFITIAFWVLCAGFFDNKTIYLISGLPMLFAFWLSIERIADQRDMAHREIQRLRIRLKLNVRRGHYDT